MSNKQKLKERISSIINEAVMDAFSNHKDSYNVWLKKFNIHLSAIIKILENDYLNKIGLRIKIQSDYNFGNKKWLASYIASSNQIGNGIISIGINYPYLYKMMKKKGIADDEYNIEAQAKITVGHEIGHGIIDFLLNYYDGNNKEVINYIHNLNDGEINEENEVEEFGECMFPDATGIYNCELLHILEII